MTAPLHSARAGVGALWCTTVATVALGVGQPLVVAALLAAVTVVGGRDVRRALRWSVPFAALIALINPVASHAGATVLVRGWRLPVLGAMDVTLEALAYGALLGLQALAVVGAFALMRAAVDADELLRTMRRVSLRSGLTAALATRLLPVLERDARRLADAQRCLPGGGASGAAVVRAVATGALDRATDLAATLEVRGFATAVRPARLARPWSRHDVAFAASAAALAGLAVASRLTGAVAWDAYPRLEPVLTAGAALSAAALAAVALLPFADRRGVR